MEPEPTSVANVIDARKEPLANVIEAAAAVVFGGGTLIFPTDTVYGIGCDPFNLQAASRIYGAKTRPHTKPLTLHLATVAEFLEYAKGNARAVMAARRLLPGPLTLIVSRPPFIADAITAGLPTLGFRVPDDPICAAILERCGPLAATSANLSGQRAYRGEEGERENLPAADLLIEAGPTRWRGESSIVDLSGPEPVLLREGVVSRKRLTELFEPLRSHTDL